MQSANDALCQYTGSESYYRYHADILLTEGVKALAENFQCYWLLDVIAFYQPNLKDNPFQVWKLEVNGDCSAIVTCTDGNDTVLRKQRIPFTDFGAKEATIWIEDDVFLLPSEH